MSVREASGPSPPIIPDHRLLGMIGRGAYGEVWLARNVMNAPRAIKIVRRQQFKSDRPYEREFAGIERYEPVSRSADGLVHVLHVGRNDPEGYFFYVMELADPAAPLAAEGSAAFAGYAPRTLRSDFKRLGRLPVADCLRLGLDIAGGLARLHDRGLVHRDVKPGNIIFVDGRAKLADIGLVAAECEGRTFVGTEGYIPPEGPGCPPADLYALGMVLYEAVTGYPPEEFPKVPPEWFAEEALPEPLEFHEVVLKACEGAKERRYQNADEMQADLALLQSGQSVRHLRALEKRVTLWRRIGRATAIGTVLAVAIALAADWRARVAAEGRAKEAQLREQAQTSLARAESAERESRHQLYTSLLEQARATVRSGELGHRVRALEAIRRAAAISNSVELRREVCAALALPDLRFEREVMAGQEFTLREIDPAFERIALARGRGPVEIRAVADNELLATLPASTNLPAYAANWSGDGQFLAVKRDYDSTGQAGDLEVWRVSDGRSVLVVHDIRWSASSFRPRQPQLLTGTGDGWIVSWDLREGKALARRKFAAAPEHLAYSPDGEIVAASYPRKEGSVVELYRSADATLVAAHLFASPVTALDWHAGGRWIGTSHTSGAVCWTDMQSGETHVLGQHKAEAVMTACSPDGAYLITGGWERELICWDVGARRRAFTIGLDSYQARFRSDGRECALLGPTSVQLHAFERPTAQRELAEDLGPRLRRATFSSDGRWLAASADKGMGLWDLNCGGPGAFSEDGFNVYCFFTADGRELFASRGNDADKDCFHWRYAPSAGPDAPPSLERVSFERPQGFSSLSLRSNAVVMTTASGSQLLAPESMERGHDRWVRTAQGINGVSPDGRWLAMYRPFSTSLYVYQLPGLERVAKLPHSASIGDFAFSPLGDELAVGSRAGVEFWSTRNWERTGTLTNFSRILYSPDARTAWLTKDLRTAGLYDLRSVQPLMMLPTGMLPLALSPDGRRLALSVDMRRLQVWDLGLLRAELAKLTLDW